MTRKALLVLASILLAACAGTPFRWSEARQIRQGMTKSSVIALVGEPTRVSTIPQGTRYVWVWVNTLAGSTRTLLVDFDMDGKAVTTPRIPDEFQD